MASLFPDPVHQGDTVALLSGLQEAYHCIKNGQYSGCASTVHFPLFQYLSAGFWRSTGHSPQETLDFLGHLNAISFLGVLALGFYFFKKRSPILSWFYLLTILIGPYLSYTKVTFNEMTAAFVTLCFIFSCLKRFHWAVIALSFVLAGITKEIAWPFLIILGVLSYWPQQKEPLIISLKKGLPGIVAGTLLTVAINAGFNYFRYASFTNQSLLTPNLQVPDLKQHLSFFLALLLSPNGGILFFIPVFFICASFLVFQTLRKYQKQQISNAFPLFTLGAVLFVLLAGFSKWYAPFGWIAWGPRLILPWIPALALLLFYFYSEEVLKFARICFGRTSAFITFCFFSILFLLPHIGIFTDFSGIIGRFFTIDQSCPRVAIIQEDPGFYYHCMNNYTWPKWGGKFIFMDATQRALHKPLLVFLLSVIILAISLRCRRLLTQSLDKQLKELTPDPSS